MRSEKEFIDLIIKTANQDERIRNVQMGGTRINPVTNHDRFQEYDIIFFSNEIDSLLRCLDWLNGLGERIMLRRQNISDGTFLIQILFTDGVILNLELRPAGQFHVNNKTITLLSKDKPIPMQDDLNEPNNIDLCTEEKYSYVCSTFWWHTQYAAKGIARDEMPYANHFVALLRENLFKMLEWRIPGSGNTLGRYWRHAKKNIDDREYNAIRKTYVNGDYRNIWNAVLTLCGLFREAARNVADICGYKYPEFVDESMSAYLTELEDEIGVKPKLINPASQNNAKAGDIDSQLEFMPYGSVLIVDDMETNLYVAKSIMEQYGLKIDLASSGSEAIGKIIKNKNYDIVFMDYLMPEMDGITTANAILDKGYTGIIVALTANNASGQENIFLANGFDAFLSKPIDTDKLNLLLNKNIRDKQPPEVLANARMEMVKRADEKRRHRFQIVSAGLMAVFIHDAEKAVAVFESYSEDSMNDYIINAHAMKSALSVMGEFKLSDLALSLEEAGRAGCVDFVKKETPQFIKALKEYIARLTPKQETQCLGISQENTDFLREKLAAIRIASNMYEKKTVKDLLNNLQRKKWPETISGAIHEMRTHLLHSDFEEISEIAGEVLDNIYNPLGQLDY